jgi:hypothetical protein
MDKKIEGLTEGAGREESRINQDFIDFLSKWSTPVLLVMAALAVAYWGWNQYKAMQITKVNKATTAYTAATAGGNPNPDTLDMVAREYAGVRSVGELASLDLADIYLLAVQRGLEPGAEFEPGTQLPDGDKLTDERRASYLDKADMLYASVAESARSVAGKEELTIEAAFGLAAVAESRGDNDTARKHLELAKEAADKGGFTVLALAAEKRIADLDKMTTLVLFDEDALPPLPEITPPPAPEIIPTEAPILDNPPLFPGAGPVIDDVPAAGADDGAAVDDDAADDDGGG